MPLVASKMDVATLYKQAVHLASDPRQIRFILPLILIADAALTAVVILKIPYTEIDFSTYMAQVALYLKGERDYTRIEGPTGPCVYPAGHVYAYSALHWATGGGADIRLAQWLFGALYLVTLGLVGLVYRASEAPPYLLPLLMLSKRLHSIFVLRLFNDCFAVFFLFLAILAYQRRLWNVGSICLSLGISVKMSLLLALPGGLVVLGQAMDARGVISQLSIMLVMQIQVALPFLKTNRMGYLARAFEFSRQFLFKWTVNWRFVGEETFLSKKFSISLLVAHATMLVVFGLTRWNKVADISLPTLIETSLKGFTPEFQRRVEGRLTSNFIATSLLTSIAIGMLCARSLHYQFYAYIAWATPLLLWKAGFHPVAIYTIWAAQEWAWNVFPSTDISSMVVVATLAIQIIGVWFGLQNDFTSVDSREKRAKHAHID